MRDKHPPDRETLLPGVTGDGGASPTFFPHLRAHKIAGIDEAGRGCLAGPVVAAAVMLPDTFHLPGLADSKVIEPSRRSGLAASSGDLPCHGGQSA